MTDTPSLAISAAMLREAFDRDFAAAPAEIRDAGLPFVRIRAGRHVYAVALSEVTTVLADRPHVALPSAASELLGVAALRGDVVSVFSLSALLGDHGETAPRWLLLVDRNGDKAAFAFDAMEGHLRITADDIATVPDVTALEPIRSSARVSGEMIPILSIAALIERLVARAGSNPTDKEW
jgi:chemotaxis signal transduction protein